MVFSGCQDHQQFGETATPTLLLSKISLALCHFYYVYKVLAIYFFNKLSACNVQSVRADSGEWNQICLFLFLASSQNFYFRWKIRLSSGQGDGLTVGGHCLLTVTQTHHEMIPANSSTENNPVVEMSTAREWNPSHCATHRLRVIGTDTCLGLSRWC